MNRLWILIGLALMVCSMAAPGEVDADIKTGPQVQVSADETVDDDLYVFAQQVVIDGTVTGDLIAFADSVSINGVVEGDILGAARTIIIQGQVKDDVRIAGQIIVLGPTSSISDDVVTAGQSLNCEPGSRIKGEVNYAGYQAIFAGSIKHNLNAATSNCELAGEFGGDVEVVAAGGSVPQEWFPATAIPKVPQGLTVSNSANIAGDLVYQSNRKANLDPGASITGSVQFKQVDATGSPEATMTDRAINAAKHFFALLVVGLIAVFAFPKWTERITTNVETKPLASVGWGVGSMVVAIATAVLVIVTIIVVAVLLGLVALENLLPAWLTITLLSTAAMVLSAIAFTTWVSKTFVGLLVGRKLLRSTDSGGMRKALALAIGLALFVGISLIPYVGSIVAIFVSLTGIGATSAWAWNAIKGKPLPTDKSPAVSMKQQAA